MEYLVDHGKTEMETLSWAIIRQLGSLITQVPTPHGFHIGNVGLFSSGLRSSMEVKPSNA